MDSYQAIYDAARSRISGGNAGQAIEDAAREAFDISHIKAMVEHELCCTIAEYRRPSVLFRPALSLDGNQWCALYGTNMQDGVAGFGNSPDAAMRAFDVAWGVVL